MRKGVAFSLMGKLLRLEKRGKREAPRFMACLPRLIPACSRVEALAGFGCETPEFSSALS